MMTFIGNQMIEIFNPIRNKSYFAIYPLDEGGYGKVWHGVMDNNFPVAIKVFKPSSDVHRDQERWLNEQHLYLKYLQHPNIITTFDQFCSTSGELIIVMERAEGSLEDYIRNRKSNDPLTVCSIGCNILNALDHIHKSHVVHRDVSLKNILWFKDGKVKLADFGISKEFVSSDEFARTFIGHPAFIPPELLMKKYSNYQSDIYQLGVVLLTLLIGYYPISLTALPAAANQMILDGLPRQIAESLIVQHGQLANIISKMLRRHNEYRYKTVMDVWQELYTEYNRIQEVRKSPPLFTLPNFQFPSLGHQWSFPWSTSA